ncbi:MAG: F0F1 ATP synthase subunit delta [Candidatus Levybacteria bacterium]|nr:F0F1 ATP synthase subunit delta [Candidatus Levybacteria bacterium]
MTRSKVIKEVAKTLSQQSELSDNVMPYLADHFTKSELKLLGKFLRLEIKKRKVVIVTSVQLQPEHKKSLVSFYEGLHVEFTQDTSLGGGMRVTKQDTVLDMSLKHYIIQMVQDLSKI